MRPTHHIGVLVAGALLTLLLTTWSRDYYPSAALPTLDAATTVFSVLATFLLIGRRLGNWLYFFVVDLVYVYVYLDRGSLIFAATFLVYAVMAVYGYRAWRVEMGAFAKTNRIAADTY